MKKIFWRQALPVCFLAVVFWLSSVAAVAAAADYEALRAENGGRLARQQRFVTTTEPAVAFSFGGLSKAVPLKAILAELAANDMRGTFFVTERELQRNGDNLDLIAAAGQDFGIGVMPHEGDDYYAYCAQIDRIQTALAERYQQRPSIVRLMSGLPDASLEEAVAAMGCQLIGQGLNVVQSKHKEAQTVDEVMGDIFGHWTTSLNRGEVVYIRTDFYTLDTLAAKVMMTIKERKIDNIAFRAYDDMPGVNPANDSAYRIVSIGDLVGNTAHHYTYPVAVGTLPAKMRPGYGAGLIDEKNYQPEFLRRYIGAPQVTEDDRMLGFTRREMLLADKTGIVKSVPDNTIFLTFDDWGMDESINKLLYVLRKHKVNGTFFIITWNMPNNPNLLRAIVEEGNEVGSHTDGHKAMCRRNEKGKQEPVLTDEEYEKDITASYEKLVTTIGDVYLPSGRPALTHLMRPPTLAISRKGTEQIMNAGFSYIVNGSGSTEDYAAVSMQSLVGILDKLTHENGRVKRGAILVMHMSTTASKTARALDILLTQNERRLDSDPAKFRVGLLGDYLTGDYSQMMRQVPAAKK